MKKFVPPVKKKPVSAPPFDGAGDAPPKQEAAPAEMAESSFQQTALASGPPARRPFVAPVAASSQARAPAARAPVARNPAAASSLAEETSAVCYNVTYCNRKEAHKKRKNRSYLDGLLRVVGDTLFLYNDEGVQAAKTTLKKLGNLPEGATVEVGSWEAEILSSVPDSKYLSGEVFMGGRGAKAPKAMAMPMAKSKLAKLSKENSPPPSPAAAAAPAARAVNPAFKPAARSQPRGLRPTHDPDRPEALVLYTGDPESASGRPSVSVVVDPFLSARLRPHQIDGVRFLYECVTGARGDLTGCLLADEMGLGKTLQVITLLWTLLKQSPYGGPTVRRAIVVCPATLVNNWRAEVKKWLGDERLGAIAVNAGPEARGQFELWANPHQTVGPLLITSYETLRKFASEAAAGQPVRPPRRKDGESAPRPAARPAHTGLLVCDEAHRLKSIGGSKTVDALLQLRCPRRVLLTGTPVQNELEEFFAIFEVACPGLLGDLPKFKRVYAGPIELSRDRNASADQKRLGAKRFAQLNKLTDTYMLRRNSEVNRQYLPPKREFTVFVRCSALQERLYAAFLRLPAMRAMLTSSSASGASIAPLEAITLLRKLCNTPDQLLSKEAAEDGEEGDAAGAAATDSVIQQLRGSFPKDFEPGLKASSGKLVALAAMLEGLCESKDDRMVVVAGWKATLDSVAALCISLGLPMSRLDGSTPPATRVDLARRFNAGNGGQVFLLSTRAGGTGLNLIGANRLVLFDCDWNPAHDEQAMARVWREGQRKEVAVYRMLTAGTIEEKIFQRQVVKKEVAALVDRQASRRHFSAGELRDLFSFSPDARCDTAALLGGGGKAAAGGAAAAAAATGAGAWRDCSEDVTDAPLRAALAAGGVTFVCEAADAHQAPPPPLGDTDGDAEDSGGSAGGAGGGRRGGNGPSPAQAAQGRLPPLEDSDSDDVFVDGGGSAGRRPHGLAAAPKQKASAGDEGSGGGFVPLGEGGEGSGRGAAGSKRRRKPGREALGSNGGSDGSDEPGAVSGGEDGAKRRKRRGFRGDGAEDEAAGGAAPTSAAADTEGGSEDDDGALADESSEDEGVQPARHLGKERAHAQNGRVLSDSDDNDYDDDGGPQAEVQVPKREPTLCAGGEGAGAGAEALATGDLPEDEGGDDEDSRGPSVVRETQDDRARAAVADDAAWDAGCFDD